ncbi:uncharacterized protein Z518_04340 [Rhinocladiella mackenziei CBS 650.93]|uniref:Tat pathway signal sequence n=1 Tax=Rhinocladiella mackenziei CBS 650.93 TaxID=1442369 RepID=A0A0D2IKY7_9EURO|nr:uncharacterized protein Z518_04340 [Rhinocladiella mackenziei CBS 650.93]KIX06364.1 hypothetical protein Z518_04340 [Rhinocladiella mackenziei CBS 650.93]
MSPLPENDRVLSATTMLKFKQTYTHQAPHDLRMEAGEEEAFLPKSSQIQEPPHGRPWVEWVLVFLLGLSVFLNVMTQIVGRGQDLDEVCALYTSQTPSPIQQDLKIKYSTVQFEGSFSNPNSSTFRLPPGPEVDEAWMSLGVQNHHYIVPEHLGERYGLNPGAAKLSPELGGGFPVLFEFEHHLHCLNLLRQSTHWNYGHYAAEGKGVFGTPEEMQYKHVNHCIDILRQQLMCQPDTGVFGQYWIKSTGELFVDFNTKHKCKNFWELKNWAVNHQVDPKKLEILAVTQRPEDVVLDDIP